MKGEYIDSQWFLKQVLAKFSVDVQRKVLERKHTLGEGVAFNLEALYRIIDDVISNEKTVTLYLKRPTQLSEIRIEKKQKLLGQNSRVVCMYCAGEHKSLVCPKYKTPLETSQYLKDHRLCLICASPKHSTQECKKRMCFTCQGPHHTSCCSKGLARDTRKVTHSVSHEPSGNKKPSNPVGRKGVGSATPRKVNHLIEEKGEQQETSVLELQTGQENGHAQVYLPMGELTIVDPATRELKKVLVLLDTGAELSFIEQKLAEDLGLPTLEETTLHLRTFGSEEVQVRTCRKVPLEVWDQDGRPLILNLLTSDVLTKACSPPPLLEEDLNFINSLDIKVNLNRSSEPTVPKVLLGCDQLWPLMGENDRYIRLPSGLHILSTRLGHLLTGQLELPRQVDQAMQKNPLENWEAVSPINTQAHTVLLQYGKDDSDLTEEELFTRFCTLESAGSEEFANAEHNTRSQVDQQVWDNSINTVEKRKDGYYVRLSWKDVSIELPDNEQIAYKRLLCLWNSLQKDEDLLQRYNSVFQEQLRSNIIEEVRQEEPSLGKRIHYIPHQMVLTPHKATTKLRIVFDASAHFSNCPSLNDMLHREPVILPKLYGLLLRFRIGHFALIADVEKAFLQVRLHEEDRDATRCLWLRDYKLPPTKENIQVFRFTRITFGLLPSPFLLAATTHYHLDQCNDDAALVSQIKENLYVDNLIITTDTMQEAIAAYKRTKAIFNDLQMNLREFVSNDSAVSKEMEDSDKSTEKTPKVLGIKWEPVGDKFEISCHVSTAGKLTKRTIASAVASVYDPMGWLAPLMHKAKRFLQSLWKDNYEWDSRLNQMKEEEWKNICSEIDGFQITIPRWVAQKSSKAALLVFADASSEGIAACAYLRTEHSCHLLMAKAKLPSLKSKSTMPKMELNAMTLALRLSNSVLEQIGSTLQVNEVSLFSDSEIVLNWITSNLRHDVGPFIKNRVMEIHSIISHLKKKGHKVMVGHISSTSNPTDCATRGLTKDALAGHFWWSGPSSLTSDKVKWYSLPLESEGNTSGMKVEEHGSYALLLAKEMREDIFASLQHFSFSEMKRIVALVVEFIKILVRRLNKRRSTPLILSKNLGDENPGSNGLMGISGNEIAVAGALIIKQHQISHITLEISSLRRSWKKFPVQLHHRKR